MLCQSVDLEFLADGSLDNLFHSILAMTAEFARMAVVRERHSSMGNRLPNSTVPIKEVRWKKLQNIVQYLATKNWDLNLRYSVHEMLCCLSLSKRVAQNA